MRNLHKVRLKRLISKLGLIKLFHLITKRFDYLSLRKSLSEFNIAFNNDVELYIGKDKCTNRVLVVCLESGYFSTALIEESILSKSLELQNSEVFVLIERGNLAEPFFERFGINNFIYFDDFYLKENRDIVFDFNTFEELFSIKYKNIDVGKHVASFFMRLTHSGFFNVSNENLSVLRKMLNFSTKYVNAIEKIHHRFLFDTCVFLERGYSPNGEIFDFFIQKDVDCIQWCGSHKENSFIFKRYNQSNSNTHPAGISKNLWEELCENTSDFGAVKKSVFSELYSSYSNQTWFSEVGTQFNTKLVNRELILEQLDLDINKKTAIIFSHLFWDATFFWGNDLYEDYKEWLIRTIELALQNDEINWIVKIHPANVVKLNRSNFAGELAEIRAIKEKFGEIPKSIRFIYPDSNISTFSLFDIMDFCITVRGTIGLESAALGKSTITCGTGRYDNFGFTFDSDTKEEYETKILNLHNFDEISEDQINLANLFAHCTFLKKPISLTSFNFHYNNDSLATCKFKFNIHSKEDFMNASDLNYISNWIVNSKVEDLLSV
jgi:hypothetical protein